MKKSAPKKKMEKSLASISSTKRLTDLLDETEKELSALEPQIEKLEKQLEKLKELKLAKQKLITLKLSIKSILANFSESEAAPDTTTVTGADLSELSSSGLVKSVAPLTSQASVLRQHSPAISQFAGKMFLPERAFREVNTVLRRKDSLNYELFRAIVFNGGIASTESIKAYLVENRIKQPSSGEGFEHVELTDISSRVNYLVRKGVVIPDGRGQFISSPGWAEPG